MINLTHFLIILKNPPKYTKNDIDLGNIPYEVYSICSIIRVCFCLSYSIRKSTILYFLFENSYFTIKLDGNKLRFLGSDERSQAILLEKALNKALRDKATTWERSTPGIYYKSHSDDKTIFDLILKENVYEKIVFFINKNEGIQPKSLDILDSFKNTLFIIPATDFSYDINNIQRTIINSKKKFEFIYLPKIRRIESKLLYINFKIDQEQDNENT